MCERKFQALFVVRSSIRDLLQLKEASIKYSEYKKKGNIEYLNNHVWLSKNRIRFTKVSVWSISSNHMPLMNLEDTLNYFIDLLEHSLALQSATLLSGVTSGIYILLYKDVDSSCSFLLSPSQLMSLARHNIEFQLDKW